jgi:hypothetical protein
MPIDLKDSKPPLKELAMMPSTLETMDFAMYEWLNEELDIHVDSNKGWKKVPVIWATAERAYQTKSKKEFRDASGALILPLMTIERTGISKDPSRRAALQGGVPNALDAKGGAIVVARRIQPEKSAEFSNAKSARKHGGNSNVGHGQANSRGISKPVYETITIPFPTYVELTYSVTVKTEYQQQMNEIFTPLVNKTGGISYFILKRDGHRYEGFMPNDFSFENTTADMGADYRTFETSFDVRILGYIIGDDKNASQPKIVRRESFVEIKVGRERAMLEDEIENYLKHEVGPPGIKGKYRP